ncbi:unnamed protein product [Amoebophrya sp. A25]|nr:unnamed protein product [Amoebophrya sp. A25]|eukprot:GSA25T00024076001.1
MLCCRGARFACNRYYFVRADTPVDKQVPLYDLLFGVRSYGIVTAATSGVNNSLNQKATDDCAAMDKMLEAPPWYENEHHSMPKHMRPKTRDEHARRASQQTHGRKKRRVQASNLVHNGEDLSSTDSDSAEDASGHPPPPRPPKTKATAKSASASSAEFAKSRAPAGAGTRSSSATAKSISNAKATATSSMSTRSSAASSTSANASVPLAKSANASVNAAKASTKAGATAKAGPGAVSAADPTGSIAHHEGSPGSRTTAGSAPQPTTPRKTVTPKQKKTEIKATAEKAKAPAPSPE